MSFETFFMALAVIAAAALYFAIGIGAANALAKAQNRDQRTVEIYLWPLVLVVYAFWGVTYE